MRNVDKHNLRFNNPLESWEDAIPLGNGLLGCLIWSKGNTLNFSLDRSDLWDTRQNFKSILENLNLTNCNNKLN